MKDQDPDYAGLGETSNNHRQPYKTNVSKISAIVDKEFNQEISSKEREALDIQERLHHASKTLHLLRYAIVSNFYNHRHCLASNSGEPKQSQIHPAVKKLIGRRQTLDDANNLSVSIGCGMRQNVLTEYEVDQSIPMDFDYGTNERITMESAFNRRTQADLGGLDYEAKWVEDSGSEINCDSVTDIETHSHRTNNTEHNYDSSNDTETNPTSSGNIKRNSKPVIDIGEIDNSLVQVEGLCDPAVDAEVNDNLLVDTETKFNSLEEGTPNPASLKRSQPSSPVQLRKIPRYIPPNDSTIGPRSPSRGLHHKTRRRIIIGNISKWLPPEWREDAATHKWTMYVRGSEECSTIDDFIGKVRFFLHPSYRPNDVVEITSPPFYLSRRGWGEFPLRVQLHFKNPFNKPMDIIHHLKLDRTYTGLQTLGSETLVDVWLNSEHTNHKRNIETPYKTDLNSRICDPVDWIVEKENFLDESPPNVEKIREPEMNIEKSAVDKNVDKGDLNTNSKGKIDFNNDILRYYVDLDHDYLGSRCLFSGDDEDNLTVRHEGILMDLDKEQSDHKLKSLQPLKITIPSPFESHENKRLLVLQDNKTTHSVTIKGLNLDRTKLKGDKETSKGISLLRKDVGRALKINRGNSVILNVDSNIPALKIVRNWSPSSKNSDARTDHADCSTKKDNNPLHIDLSDENKGYSNSNKDMMRRNEKNNESFVKVNLVGESNDDIVLNVNLFNQEKNSDFLENSILRRKKDSLNTNLDERQIEKTSLKKQNNGKGNNNPGENELTGEDPSCGILDNESYKEMDKNEEVLKTESNYYYNQPKQYANFEGQSNSDTEVQNPSNFSSHPSNFSSHPSKGNLKYINNSDGRFTNASSYQKSFEQKLNITYVLDKSERPKTILGKDKMKSHSKHDFQDLVSSIKNSKIDDFENLLRFVIKRVPIVTKESLDSDYKRAYPFSCISKEQFLSLNLGKRAALEWNRAKLVLDLIKLKLGNEKLWNIKEILIWARLHGHTPFYKTFKIPKITDFDDIRHSGLSEFKSWISNSNHLSSNMHEEEIDVLKDEEEKKSPFGETHSLIIEANNTKGLPRCTIQKNMDSKMMVVELENNMVPLHRFVCETAREIGIKLVCEEILPNVAYSAASRMIMQAVKCLMDDILRLSLAQAWQRQSGTEYPKSISLTDVQRGMLNREEFDIFSNLGLASRYID